MLSKRGKMWIHRPNVDTLYIDRQMYYHYSKVWYLLSLCVDHVFYVMYVVNYGPLPS